MANPTSATQSTARPPGVVNPLAQSESQDDGASVAVRSPEIMDQIHQLQQQLAALACGDSASSTRGSSTRADITSGAGTTAAPEVVQHIESLRQDVSDLAESVRSQLTSAVDALTASQSAASRTHSEIIRTLTEAIFSSAASSPAEDQLQSLFGELETRICSTLRATLAQLPSNAKDAIEPASESSAGTRGSGLPVASRPAETTADATATADDKHSWEAIRRALLDETPLDASSSSQNDASLSSAAAAGSTNRSAATSEIRTENRKEYQIGDNDLPLEIPEPVDIDALDPQALRQALREREQLICSIIGRLRRQSYTSNDMLTTEQLRALMHDMPEQFAVRVNHTLQRIDDQLRLGELELSLERARLARQASQLDYVRQQVEHNARQLGYIVNPDGTLSFEGAMTPRSSSSRRWLGKLGFSE